MARLPTRYYERQHGFLVLAGCKVTEMSQKRQVINKQEKKIHLYWKNFTLQQAIKSKVKLGIFKTFKFSPSVIGESTSSRMSLTFSQSGTCL